MPHTEVSQDHTDVTIAAAAVRVERRCREVVWR
jgi:hypothetical protein